MQIDCGTLRRALKSLVRLVPKRATVPILEHVLFEPTDSGVALTATDLTTRVKIVVAAKDPIATCLPTRPLLEFAACVETGVLLIDGDARVAVVTGSGSKLELPALPTTEFPAAFGDPRVCCALPDGSELIDALRWAIEAIGVDPTRPQLMGVLLDDARVVGVDGHRLHVAAVSDLACPTVLVPPIAVQLVIGLYEAGPLEIATAADTVRFSTAAWTITARALTEKFPPYQQVIPTAASAAFSMIVSTRDLDTVLRRVSRRGDRRGVMPVRLRATARSGSSPPCPTRS